jgi:hypothetical protein
VGCALKQRQQVGLVLLDLANRRWHVGGFGDDAKLVLLALQDRADAIAHDRVIVGNDHGQRSIDLWAASLHRHTVPTASDRS